MCTVCAYTCAYTAHFVHPHALIPEMPSCDNRCPHGADRRTWTEVLEVDLPEATQLGKTSLPRPTPCFQKSAYTGPTVGQDRCMSPKSIYGCRQVCGRSRALQQAETDVHALTGVGHGRKICRVATHSQKALSSIFGISRGHRKDMRFPGHVCR